MIQKNWKGLERMEVFITSYPIWRFFLAMNIIAIHILLEMQKVTFTKIVYEKNLMKRKVFNSVFIAHSNIYNEAFLRR